jgi:steroid 5-alpha reductase family enzyme
MSKAEKTALIAIPSVILIGLGVALAGSSHSARAFGLPIFGLAVFWAYLVNWLVFIPSFAGQTEKYFDLTGSLTYISVTLIGVILTPELDGRTLLLAGMVIIWAGRLGTFLFRRIQKDGKDGRFDALKPSFLRFLNVWTIQGLWVTFTLAAGLAAITSSQRVPLDIFAVLGTIIWLTGFAIEVIADNQKSRFRADPANKGKFIQSGLWARSRHPNYFGEIVLWIGVAVIALPVLQGWQWVTMISPFFVVILLTRVSGVPLLENRADEKWGGQADYEAYKERTPVLFPRLTP